MVTLPSSVMVKDYVLEALSCGQKQANPPLPRMTEKHVSLFFHKYSQKDAIIMENRLYFIPKNGNITAW